MCISACMWYSHNSWSYICWSCGFYQINICQLRFVNCQGILHKYLLFRKCFWLCFFFLVGYIFWGLSWFWRTVKWWIPHSSSISNALLLISWSSLFSFFFLVLILSKIVYWNILEIKLETNKNGFILGCWNQMSVDIWSDPSIYFLSSYFFQCMWMCLGGLLGPGSAFLIFYIIESLAIHFNFEQDFWKPRGKTVFFIDFILPGLSITMDGLLMSNIYDLVNWRFTTAFNFTRSPHLYCGEYWF